VGHWAKLPSVAARPWLVMSGLSILGAVSCLYATHRGPGLFPDSATYLEGARNLLGGRGFVEITALGTSDPITDYPPLYSFVLAGLAYVGIDPEIGARWLQAGLFGATVFLGSLAIRHLTSGSARAMVVGGVVMLTSVDLLGVFAQVGSEALFITLGLGALLLLGTHAERPDRVRLVGAGIAVGLTSLTRYAGVVLIATGLAGLLLLGRRGSHARLANLGIFGALGSLPLAVFMTRNWLVERQLLGESRILAFHPVTAAQARAGLNTVWAWLTPDRELNGSFAALFGPVPGLRKIVVAVAAAAAVIALLRGLSRTGRERTVIKDQSHRAVAGPSLLWLPTVFGALYGGFLLVSMSWLDAAIKLEPRILSPAFVASVIAGVALIDRWLALARHSRVTIGGVAVAAFLVLTSYGHAAVNWMQRGHKDGLGYASRSWQESEVLRQARALPKNVLIYTNAADVFTVVTGRPALDLPFKFDIGTRQPNPRYPSQFEALRVRLRAGAVLVYLDRASWRRWLLPSKPALQQQLGLRVRARAADGTIYEASGGGAARSK